jgi:hypothetical protein
MTQIASRCLLMQTIVIASLCATAGHSATVRGRVVNSRSSGPVANASVVLSGTRLTATSDSEGRFTIQGVPVGTYDLRAGLTGSGDKHITIAVDSVEQVVEVTIFLRVLGRPLVPGCIPEFTVYQSELAAYLKTHPGALSFEISDFREADSSTFASVMLTCVNNSPHDIYLMKDHDPCGQMYVQNLSDASSVPVQSNAMKLHSSAGEPCLHELQDIIRIPKNGKVVADTVRLWQYDVAHLPSGDYRLQLVYVFPRSRSTGEDARYQLSSPMTDEKGIGELYCMTLRGRFESNVLSIHHK